MGLVLLSLNLEPLLERLLVNGLLFWEKATIRAMVIKNLVAHRKRNTKTTIMYALSLGFIIFIMVSYNNLLDGFAYQREQSSGVYLKVMARGTVDKPKTPLDWRHHIRNVQGLEDYLRNHTHIIKDHSWVTHHYNDAWQDHGGPVLENLGRFVRAHTAHDRTHGTQHAQHASSSNRAPLFCGKQVGLRYESDARRRAQLHGCAIQRVLDPQRRYVRST